MPITPFSTLDEAIKLANQTEHGLASYSWTNNIANARAIMESLEFGMVGINDWAPYGTEGPFTGWKESGVSSESGSEGLNEYLETKLVALGS